MRFLYLSVLCVSLLVISEERFAAADAPAPDIGTVLSLLNKIWMKVTQATNLTNERLEKIEKKSQEMDSSLSQIQNELKDSTARIQSIAAVVTSNSFMQQNPQGPSKTGGAPGTFTKKSGCFSLPKVADCEDILHRNPKASNGIYTIYPPEDGAHPVKALCDMEDGGWTVVLKRSNGSVNFSRSWQEMKKQVGSLEGEHWLGLDSVHRLTSSGKYSLRVELWHGEEKRVSLYNLFRVAAEAYKYKLTLMGYDTTPCFSNTSRGSLETSDGDEFSTYDHNYGGSRSCALTKGPGWSTSCSGVKLFGPYRYKAGTWYVGSDSMSWVYFNSRTSYHTLSALTLKVRRTHPKL